MLDPWSRPTILPPGACRSAGHGVDRSKWGRPKAGPGGHEDDEDSRRESETSFCGFVVNLLPLLPLDMGSIARFAFRWTPLDLSPAARAPTLVPAKAGMGAPLQNTE